MPQRAHEERVVVLAPAANDAGAMAAMLREHDLAAEIGRDALHARELIQHGAGVLLLTEEALDLPQAERLLEALHAQPSWSELPVIILTSGGSARLAQLLDVTAPSTGSITLLERPISSELLLRSVHVALNARQRQYQVRALLEEQERRRLQLEELNRHAEQELEARRLAEQALGVWAAQPLGYESRSAVANYAVAAAALVFAVAVRAMADPLVESMHPLATLYGAVAVAVWFGGLWPSIWAAVIGYVACDWLFIDPRYSWTFSPADVYGVVLYVLGVVAIIGFGVRMRTAQAHAHASAQVALERQRHAEKALEERNRAEAKAREADERLRVAIKDSRLVLAQCDRELRYRWIHNPHPDFPSDVLGRRDDEVDRSETGRRLVALKQRVLETGRGLEADLAFPLADGARTFNFALEPLRDETGAVIGVTSAALDITDRKRAEDALRESEELFRALAENLPQLAWMTRADGWIFWYNRRWFDFTGTTLAEMQGWGWQAVHHPEHVGRVTELFRHALETGTAFEDTFPIRGRDGRYRWFLTRAFPIRDAGGRITRWFGTNTDITVLRDTQEALRAAQTQIRQYAEGLEKTVVERTAKLQEMVQELEAFSYSIAHDMRSPLRSMIGFSDILREEHASALDDTARDYLRRISASAGRLDHLIQDVLNYSRIVREDLSLGPIPVRQLIAEVVESYPNLAVEKEHIHVDPAVPDLVGNRAALTQVLSNLLGNAVKFVPKGVTPSVRIHAERGTPPPGRGRGGVEWVRVWIEDNGIGIDPKVGPRLFQMFQRFTRPGLYEGTGMGLAIVRKAIERMGGAIGVEAAKPRGSRFWFVLPAAGAKLPPK